MNFLDLIGYETNTASIRFIKIFQGGCSYEILYTVYIWKIWKNLYRSSPKEAVDKAKTELSVISEIDLNRISAYLADSLEIDKDGVILDECGNIVGVI